MFLNVTLNSPLIHPIEISHYFSGEKQLAVEAAYEGSNATHNPIEDYVWRVTNLSTGTSARYRVDAGGHLRILPEERP